MSSHDQPIIRLPDDGLRHRTLCGDVLSWIAGEAATDGGFSIQERIAPPGARSQPHVHHHLIEAFYVIDGTCEFIVGDETVAASAGTFVLAPKGTTHAWSVTGDQPAKMLVFFSPSAKLAFFDEMQALIDANADSAAFRELAERYRWT